MKKISAFLFCLIMLTAPLAGCFGSDDPVEDETPVENLDEALRAVNIESFAFQASIFTEQLDDVYRAYDKINASAIMVNDHTAFRDDVMPFAGLDTSGLGVGGIPYTVEEMQFEKMVILKK